MVILIQQMEEYPIRRIEAHHDFTQLLFHSLTSPDAACIIDINLAKFIRQRQKV